MIPETTSILFRAADRVEFKGWCQEAGARGWNGVRLYIWESHAVQWDGAGAIQVEAGHSMKVTRTATDAVYSLLQKMEYGAGLLSYNDAPNRTAAEVAHLLRAAALEDLWP